MQLHVKAEVVPRIPADLGLLQRVEDWVPYLNIFEVSPSDSVKKSSVGSNPMEKSDG